MRYEYSVAWCPLLLSLSPPITPERAPRPSLPGPCQRVSLTQPPLRANFLEPPQDEVRGTSKFSGSRLVASRNRLLRFLAPFVATSAGLCPRGHKLPPLTAISRYRGLEIATTNFAEFLF